jgi:GntR family transcriptional regulator
MASNPAPEGNQETPNLGSWEDEIQIDRSSIRPLYLQVKEALERWIINSAHEGSLAPGDRLPSENELSEKLNISTITIKRALDELRRQGMIQRIQGRGSFLTAQKKLELSLPRMFSLTTFTRESGMRPARKILDLIEMEAPASISRHLNLKPSARVVRLTRLRLMDGIPVSTETSFLPLDLFPDLISVYKEHLSLYEVMIEHYGHEVVKAHDIMGPILIKPGEANALEIPAGTLGFLVERTGVDARDTPLEYTKMVFRGDLCNFTIDYTKETHDNQSPAE